MRAERPRPYAEHKICGYAPVRKDVPELKGALQALAFKGDPGSNEARSADEIGELGLVRIVVGAKPAAVAYNE